MAATACSQLSVALGEELFATASEASAWLLVEQPGPWGHTALVESRLPREVGEELQARTKALAIKALLVKPTGRRAATGRCFVGRSDQGATFLDELAIADPRELLDLDLEAIARGTRPADGRAVDGPLYLVCTNSRRDACCARLGRPVAAALAETRPGQVFECSHLGGHRFAANLVCLPDGLIFGRLTPDGALRVVEESERRRIVLEHLRGRSSLPPAAQAADHFVREREGLRGIDDLRLVDADGHRVTLRGDATLYRVSVERREADQGRPTSCREEKLERPAAWSLVALDREPLP
jgi:hypothetical protein